MRHVVAIAVRELHCFFVSPVAYVVLTLWSVSSTAHGTADKTVNSENSKRYHEACKKHGVPTKLVLVEGGIHGPTMLGGKPAIRETKEDYADSMIKWIIGICAR